MGNCLFPRHQSQSVGQPPDWTLVVQPPTQQQQTNLYPQLLPTAPPPYELHDPNPLIAANANVKSKDGKRTIRGVQRERPSVIVPENITNPSTNRILVAAIDVGTTFSGYAFSFRHEYESDKLKISTNMWAHNSGLSAKAPSAILIGPNKQVEAYGYEAELKYADLVETSNAGNYYFFEKFKLILYNKKDLNYNTKIKDITGKEMHAIDVFGLVIYYLKNHLLQRLRGQDSSSWIDDNMIHWVLTVPAIWNEKAKQFMRKAAEQAGITSDNLTLALEPEAASLYCKTVQDNVSGNQRLTFGKGSGYILVDLGGGTVDVTAHEIHTDGTLKELHQATGGRWGGSTVDIEFNVFLTKIFGSQIIEKARRTFPNEFLELQMDFEIKKRVFQPLQDTPIALKMPVCVLELFYEIYSQTIVEYLQNSTMQSVVEFKRDKMLISPTHFNSFFTSSTSRIISHIQSLLNKPQLSSIDTILLVGGFSESHVIKQAISSSFPNLRVVNPNDCSLAVLKGAVLFGHNPHAISSRICKFTYGVAITIPFVPGEHPESKKQVIRGFAMCDDIFDIHLKIGEKAEIGKPTTERMYEPVEGDHLALLEENPRFVTEESCFELGSLIVDLGSSRTGQNVVNVSLHYCGTELAVVARENRTGKIMQAKLDFLG